MRCDIQYRNAKRPSNMYHKGQVLLKYFCNFIRKVYVDLSSTVSIYFYLEYIIF